MKSELFVHKPTAHQAKMGNYYWRSFLYGQIRIGNRVVLCADAIEKL